MGYVEIELRKAVKVADDEFFEEPATEAFFGSWSTGVSSQSGENTLVTVPSTPTGLRGMTARHILSRTGYKGGSARLVWRCTTGSSRHAGRFRETGTPKTARRSRGNTTHGQRLFLDNGCLQTPELFYESRQFRR
jgi:hypothetical protein